MAEQGHGGRAIARALKTLGVGELFTLTGGHIFPILDGCHGEDIRIVDTRHEQSAAFAAEGWGRLTRTVGVVAVTAGPGVTNTISPLTQAGFNSAPLLALAGRAPAYRWGQGSLQEIDHVPLVAPVAEARTVLDVTAVADEVRDAGARALRPGPRPQFLDFPLDVLFNTTDLVEPAAVERDGPAIDAASVTAVAATIAGAQRPMMIAGSRVWLDHGEAALRELAEAAELPVYMNGQGRGCLPADHRLAFARSRSKAIREADVVIVAGTPLDFRLGFGQGFAAGARIVHLDSSRELLADHVDLAASAGGPLGEILTAVAAAVEAPPDTKAWQEELRAVEDERRDAAQPELRSPATPIHPMRIYGELVPLLERDAIVVCDGGDFASYAGREVASFEPGCWLDPGPYGCLGCGFGYAIAARVAHPDRQVVLLLGDGALGFSGMEMETLTRLNLPVVCVVGNNGIWGLEKHPMRNLYGYDVAAELQPGLRYDRMMESLGGRGELVTDPEEVGPALRRAFETGDPALVNVVTDPEIAYPRSANLA